MTTTIRTTEDALSWIRENAPGTKIEDGKVVYEWVCGRCSGTGNYPSSLEAGRCFGCMFSSGPFGMGKVNRPRRTMRVDAKKWAQKEKARQKAAAKRKSAWDAGAEDRKAAAAAREAARQEQAAVWAAEAAQRQAEKEAKLAAMCHVGTIGKRSDFTVKLVHVVSWPNNFGGGCVRLHIMEDVHSNKLTWKASGASLRFPAADGIGEDLWEIGETRTVKGTVKEHTEYKGEKQTVLTRLAPAK